MKTGDDTYYDDAKAVDDNGSYGESYDRAIGTTTVIDTVIIIYHFPSLFTID